MPEDIDKKRYGFWRLSELPIIPEPFQVKVSMEKRSKERFDYLKKLISRKDVDKVLNACDAGREGELIFTYIYELAKSKKPVQRLWMQSMTQQAIRDAFQRPRTPEQMQGLQDAAVTALIAGVTSAVWLSPEGEVERLSLTEARRRAEEGPPLVVHARATARRLNDLYAICFQEGLESS